MVTKEIFGKLPDGTAVPIYTLQNKHGMTAKVSAMGCTLVSLTVPDKNGNAQETMLGFDTLEGYLACNDYIGATVGRFANRICYGKFSLNGKQYSLTLNDGEHSLHGGIGGVSRKVWQEKIEGDVLTLSCACADGEDGYPGNFTLSVRVFLDEENAIHLAYTALCDEDCICNPTNHAYFNFLGGKKTVLEHVLWLKSEEYTRTDAELIPLSNEPVAGTPYDFRKPRPVGEAIYDNNFNFTDTEGVVATLWEKETGIFMEMLTDRPSVQIYSSCMLPAYIGAGGIQYGKGTGLCLETQVEPNAPNRPGCTGYIMKAGEPWTSETVYRFSVK